MTAPRPYRSGLGLPEAIIIRSDPAPINRWQQHSHSPSDENTPAQYSHRPPPKWDTYSAWKEWNTNPSLHGPPNITRPPSFVLSTTNYDDLGRSVIDGVQVDVNTGKDFPDGDRRDTVQSGEEVAGWYKALSSTGTSRSGTPGPGPSTMAARVARSQNQRQQQEISSGSISMQDSEVIDMTGEDDDDITLEPTEVPTYSSKAHETPPPPLRIHRKEWFIRRALLTASQKDPQRTQPKAPIKYISERIDIPDKPRVVPVKYVLGPENAGYKILKERLGWEGGGLGKPEGWIAADIGGEDQSVSQEAGVPINASEEKSDIPKLGEGDDGIVDLTGDTDDDTSELEFDVDQEEQKAGGPGRTAPIATTLKLDRLGLGHKRAAARDHLESTKKKVTHTAAEIREAQRRSQHKYNHGVELGKKGKIRWKDRDKKDREERKRLLAAINA